MDYYKVGVIGAGTIGISISVDLVFHGISTVLIDISPEALKKAREEIIKYLRFAPLLDKSLSEVEPGEALEKITFSAELRDIGVCSFIVENITENWEMKDRLYRELDNICGPGVCFGANTSCIPVTKIGSVTKRPDKVIGMHFMNPAFLKKAVEVIRGFYTSDECLEAAKKLLGKLGKEAIVVNDLAGFVSNRISHLFMNEAAFVVHDQIASPSQVDEIFKKCFGHEMGPLETADLIGLDTVVNSLNVLYESYQDSKYRCCPLLRKMVDAGLLGRKSGKGFYDYSRHK